jgi:hypothetical protein
MDAPMAAPYMSKIETIALHDGVRAQQQTVKIIA